MSTEGDRTVRVFRQNPDVVSSRLGDAGVLVNLRTNRILELNATGIRIWELIGDGRALSDIGSQLQREFDVSSDELQRELTRLMDDLSREGLVDVASG
jgi:Coenzyme PQQ synthesis protein D (PqqD)